MTPFVEMTGLLPDVRVLAWDETRNDSGSHKQRAAELVVRHASEDGYKRVVVGSCGNYGLAISVAASEANLEATIVIPAGSNAVATRAREWGATVKQIDGGYEDAVRQSKLLAAAGRAVDGNVDGPYATEIMRALAKIGYDLADHLAGPPGAVWLPLGNGTTATALATAFERLRWKTPIVGVTSLGNNSILSSWPRTTHTPLPREGVAVTAAREALVNWCSLHGQAALDALHANGGQVMGAVDTELVAAAKALTRWAIAATPAGAAGVAGLLAEHARFSSRLPQVAIVTGR